MIYVQYAQNGLIYINYCFTSWLQNVFPCRTAVYFKCQALFSSCFTRSVLDQPTLSQRVGLLFGSSLVYQPSGWRLGLTTRTSAVQFLVITNGRTWPSFIEGLHACVCMAVCLIHLVQWWTGTHRWLLLYFILKYVLLLKTTRIKTIRQV